EVCEGLRVNGLCEPRADLRRTAGGYVQPIPGGGLSAFVGRIHCAGVRVHDALVEGVLDVAGIGNVVESMRVGFVFGEQQRRIAVRVPAMLAEHLMLNEHMLAVLSEVRLRSAIAP